MDALSLKEIAIMLGGSACFGVVLLKVAGLGVKEKFAKVKMEIVDPLGNKRYEVKNYKPMDCKRVIKKAKKMSVKENDKSII